MGGAQELSLDSGCVTFSTVIHELMHVVGFDHEQQRPDQSRYITVNFDNIKKGKLFVC
jgi:Notch-like protein